MAPSFNLTPRDFSPPSDGRHLRVSFTTSAREGRDPIFPATYLQVSYKFGNGQEIFGDIFTARDVVSDAPGSGVYHIDVPSKGVPVARVKREEDLDAEVSLHAWKDQRYLDSWVVGEIKERGLMS
jgi:hypothetical protein